MSVQIKINDLELLELAKISTSLTDLSRKLKIRPNNKNLNEQGYSCIAREIGCSDNAIRKHLKKHKVF